MDSDSDMTFCSILENEVLTSPSTKSNQHNLKVTSNPINSKTTRKTNGVTQSSNETKIDRSQGEDCGNAYLTGLSDKFVKLSVDCEQSENFIANFDNKIVQGKRTTYRSKHSKDVGLIRRRSKRLAVLQQDGVNNKTGVVLKQKKLLQNEKSAGEGNRKQTTIDNYYTKIETCGNKIDTFTTNGTSLTDANIKQALQDKKQTLHNTCITKNEFKNSSKVLANKKGKKRCYDTYSQSVTLNCFVSNSKLQVNPNNVNYEKDNNREKFNENREKRIQEMNHQLEEAVKLMESSVVKVLKRLKEIKQEKLQERVLRKLQESQRTIENLQHKNRVDTNISFFSDLTITKEEKAQNMAFLRQITAHCNKY